MCAGGVPIVESPRDKSLTLAFESPLELRKRVEADYLNRRAVEEERALEEYKEVRGVD